ncbi:hypothetical protein GLYMA_14G079950v4 [Glycine max]|nr:hypothetical protein GLYMA_14G079950v4 [Glycine max]KAH1093591.1 hypothetical protein GYH30_039366 [Glycine max]
MPLTATSSDTDSHTRSPFLTRDGASMQPTFWRPPHRAFSLVSTVWPCLAVFLALFCQCLADPQSNDHTIVLYLFPATFPKTATTRDQRHTSLLSFNLKASLVDLSSFFFKGKQCSSSSPKIAMWSTCTTNSKHRCTRPHPRP